jgi:hypothetical protein
MDVECKKDLCKLMIAYKNNGYLINSEQAEDIWSDYSEALFASWMMMGDDLDGLFESTKEFAMALKII